MNTGLISILLAMEVTIKCLSLNHSHPKTWKAENIGPCEYLISKSTQWLKDDLENHLK